MIREQVISIIDRRKQKVELFKAKAQRLEDFIEAISSLKEKIQRRGVNSYAYEYIGLFDRLMQTAGDIKEGVNRMQLRYDREYVAVSAFGVTQSGKSTFWNALTELNEKKSTPVIPIGGLADKSCTMVKVSYFNVDSIDKEGCTIYYYTEEEFKLLINNYLKAAGINHLIVGKEDLKGDYTKQLINEQIRKNTETSKAECLERRANARKKT